MKKGPNCRESNNSFIFFQISLDYKHDSGCQKYKGGINGVHKSPVRYGGAWPEIGCRGQFDIKKMQ